MNSSETASAWHRFIVGQVRHLRGSWFSFITDETSLCMSEILLDPSSGSGNVLPALAPEMMDPGDLHPTPQPSRFCKGPRALGKFARPLMEVGLQTTVPELDYMKT